MDELREAIWDQLPADAIPERFEQRRALLLTAAASLAAQLADAADDGTGARRAGTDAAGLLRLRVLDAGCGSGHFAEALLEAGYEVIAADAADGALARTADRAPGAEPVRWADGAPLAVPSGSVDLVWAGETLEHVGDGEAWLGELQRVLRPGGRLLLTTPDHPFALRLRLALSRRAFDDHVAPWRDHLRFFTAATLSELLERADFEVLGIAKAYGRPWARETLVANAQRPAE